MKVNACLLILTMVFPFGSMAVADGAPVRCESLFRPVSSSPSVTVDDLVLGELGQLREESLRVGDGPLGSFLKAKFNQVLDILSDGNLLIRQQLLSRLGRPIPQTKDSDPENKKKIDLERQTLRQAIRAELWFQTDLESATLTRLDDRQFNTMVLGSFRGSGVSWSGDHLVAIRPQAGPLETVRTYFFDIDKKTIKPWVFGEGLLSSLAPAFAESINQQTRLYDLDTGQLILSTSGELVGRSNLLNKDYVLVKVGPPNKKAQYRFVSRSGSVFDLGPAFVASADGSRIAYFSQEGQLRLLETGSGKNLPVPSVLQSGKPSRREINGESAICVDVNGADYAYFVEDNSSYLLPSRNISWDQIGNKILSQRLFDPATNQLSLEIQDLGRGQVHRTSGTRALVSPNQRWAVSVGGSGGTKTALLDLHSGDLKLLDGRYMKFSNDSRWLSESLMFTTQPALMDLASGIRYQGHQGRDWTPISYGDAVLVESEHGQLVIADGAVVPYETADLHAGQFPVLGDSRQHTGASPSGQYIVTSRQGKIVFLKIRN